MPKLIGKLRCGAQYDAVLRDKQLSASSTAPYPNWFGIKVPVEVVSEYDNFYVLEVLPHTNPTTIFADNEFRSYWVTVDKIDILIHRFEFFERE